jgi:hypothetical protein
VAARVRGSCTVLVTKSGAVEDCQSWRIQSRTRELPLAIVMLTLCRNSDFCLRASQPEPPASSSFSRSRGLEVRPDDSRVELEANAAVVVKGNRDELQRRVHRRDGPIVLAVLACLGFGRGSERRGLGVTCASSREGGGEVLSGHRGNDGEVDTHAPLISGYSRKFRAAPMLPQ